MVRSSLAPQRRHRSARPDDSPQPSVRSTHHAFRPGTRSRARIAAGLGLLALAVVVNLAVYRSLDDRRTVLQVVRDVPAGQQITVADLRAVKVGVGDDVRTISAASLASVVGQYAKVRLVSGALIVHESLQRSPLVAPGSALVAVVLAAGELPVGLRERSHVQVVLRPDSTSRTSTEPLTSAPVQARVVGLPTTVQSSSGQVALTLEVAESDAIAIATTASVRVVLLDPAGDPAASPEGPA